MLTKKDRQPSGSMPIISTQSAGVQEPLESRFFTQPPVEQAPAPSKPAEEPALFYASEDKDPELAWPEWLKSLGAETLESEPEPRSAPAAPETQQPATFQPWEDQIDQTLSEADEQQLATLEHLENDLRSQGFVPLQPGTLSTIAQQPTLSSAFAELSNLKAQPATPEQSIVPDQPVIPEQPAASVAPAWPGPPLSAPSGQTQPESWWADTLNQLAPGSAAEQPISSGPAPTQVPEPVVVNPTTDVPQGAPLLPGYRADALLENELETTMRRPAIRLQPVQHSAAHLDAPSTLNRGRSGTGDKAQEGNLSNKERLLRGYQFQLAGAYDDAMQEYRLIIRNAPELLDEIISNVRALLKLAPKYSAGFRVLGDAYMRHGEYLQAMEAYNKALTIAKKAKSQSN
jgi:hypothetical protein